MSNSESRNIAIFNTPTEIGLRATVALLEIYPERASLQRLIVFDYLLVHSDDIPDGPQGLHPKTPYRSGELLVRRDTLQRGLYLFMSRGLVTGSYAPEGLLYEASELTASFIDALDSVYTIELRARANWVANRFTGFSDQDLEGYASEHLGQWGAEFESESLLWEEHS
jgi:hypothetical protein